MKEYTMFLHILQSFLEWFKTYNIFWFWISVLVAALAFLVLWPYFISTVIHYLLNSRVPTRQLKRPFTMCVDCQSTSFPGVRCRISSQKLCYILPFWGVPAHDFFEMMKMNWSAMKYSLLENGDNTFKNKCIAADPFTRLDAGDKKILIFLPPPCVYVDDRMDQDLLPLVIIILLMEDSIENVEESFIFVQATIIKIPSITMSIQRRSFHREPNFPDNVSRIPKVVGTYVRELNSRASGLVQRIYDGAMYSGNINTVEVPSCVACHQRNVNIVIFPCLHANLCRLCYNHYDICPSCSGPTSHYIVLGPTIEIPQN